jgi:hypothetical protein
MKLFFRIMSIVVTATFVFSALPAMSQDKPADTMELVRQKIKTDKKLFVAQNLGLTESEAKAFWPIYETYQKKLSPLMERTLKLVEEFALNYNTMSEDMAQKLVDDHLSIQKERLELVSEYLSQFRKTLPEKKVARYYQLENKINAVTSFEIAARIPLLK